MPNIRIKDIPTTASATSSTDFIGIDGSANGTRKLSAYSPTFGGNVTVSGTTGVTATDLTLGTSGPSVKSSLSARAPRQGLGQDGTAASSTSVPAYGTSDFTASAFINTDLTVNVEGIFGSNSAGGFGLFVYSSGQLGAQNIGIATVGSSTGAISANKTAHVVYTRSGTTGTFYINGVSAGTITDSTNYTAVTNLVGNVGGLNVFKGSISGAYLYNRALSASEVVALYEAGAPAGADYNSAGQTISNATWTNGSSPFSSFSSASGAAVSGTSSGFATAGSTIAAVGAGKRVRVSLSLTLTSGQAPQVYLATNANQGPGTALSNTVTLSAGSNVVELVSTNSSAASLNIAVTAATNFSITSVAVVGSGLLLAPDAAQAGGGLVWYDTSGNAANITLPASGVSWNVPSSRVLGGNWTTSGNLTVSGRDLTLGSSESVIYFGTPSANYLYYNGSSLFLRVGSVDRITIPASTGNVLIGTTTDAGGKLQIATGASNTLLIGNDATYTSYNQISLNGTRTNSGVLGMIGGGAGDSQLYLLAPTGGGLVFQIAASTVFSVNSSGNATFAGTVIAGTWSSGTADKLKVSTAVNDYAAYFANIASSGGSYGIRLHTNTTAATDYLLVATSGAGGGSTRFIIKSDGTLNAPSLPTSSAGLSAGDIWNDGGTLKIV